jgi:hypothetical protein
VKLPCSTHWKLVTKNTKKREHKGVPCLPFGSRLEISASSATILPEEINVDPVVVQELASIIFDVHGREKLAFTGAAETP